MAALDAFNPGQEAATVTARPELQTVQARNDPNGSVNALVAALGSESTQRNLAQFSHDYEVKKTNDQMGKIDFYAQTFENDHVSGAVSQAQLKQRFPEMVPVIAARVAESIGKKRGALDIAPIIEKINGDDMLRLDTKARAAYIATEREKLSKNIPAGNDFYAAGVVSAMDRSFNEQELKWQSQTAAYQTAVQLEAFSGEVHKALVSPDPKAALEAIDKNYGVSSSLNPQERNKAVVSTAIAAAAAGDDPSLLAVVPQRFLNIHSKAELAKAGLQIETQRMAKYQRGKVIEEDKRTESERLGKLEILSVIGKGGEANPANYLSNAVLHDFAVKMLETPKVSDAASQAAVLSFRTRILAAGNVGSVGTVADLTAGVFALRGLVNPKDLGPLIAEIPKLMEGQVLMNTPEIQSAFKNHISTRLDDLARSPVSEIATLMGAGNLRGGAASMFEGQIRQGFETYYKDNKNEWPSGAAARAIIQEAVTTTSISIDSRLDPKNWKAATTPKATRATSSGRASPTAPQATTQPGLPKGVTLSRQQ